VHLWIKIDNRVQTDQERYGTYTKDCTQVITDGRLSTSRILISIFRLFYYLSLYFVNCISVITLKDIFMTYYHTNVII